MNYAVILAGGQGSRFWPLSREYLPKQFLSIAGKDTFLEATLRRTLKIIPKNNVFIVTHRIYLKEIKRYLKKFAIPQENVILEPRPLNTLPAICLSARIIELKDPQAVLLVLPSDHYIKDDIAFKRAVLKALKYAKKNALCLMGIKPTQPCSGYGYIRAGRNIEDGIFLIKSFQEKPTPRQAELLLHKKDIFWNSGIFCFKSSIILGEAKAYQAGLYRQISKIKKKEDIKYAWKAIKAISIDYGILEKSRRLVMVKAKFYWRDLGSWDALVEILPSDAQGNIVLADTVSLDSRDNLMYSSCPNRVIAGIGLKDLIVVDTPDALLLCRKDKSQEIKKIVETLKVKRRECV